MVLRHWRAEIRGRIDPQIDIGAGAPACSRRQACQCPSRLGVRIARLVPRVCGPLFFGGWGILPPRKQGLHVRLTY